MRDDDLAVGLLDVRQALPPRHYLIRSILSPSIPFAMTIRHRFIVKSRFLVLASSVPLSGDVSRHGDP